MFDEKMIHSIMPTESVTFLQQQRRSDAIYQAVQRFAEEVPLSTLQQHLLGLIVDEAIVAVSPRRQTFLMGSAANDVI